MPSSRELRGLDLAQALTRGFGRFSQGYGEGQGEEEQIRRQEFMTAGEAAGQPVTSLPARGGGLLWRCTLWAPHRTGQRDCRPAGYCGTEECH